MSPLPRIAPRHRGGFTYLEFQVAFAILGITMAGLCPIIAAQLRLAARIEQRVYCLVPSSAIRIDHPDRMTLTLPSDGAASSGGRWSRRLGYSRTGMRLEVADVSRGLGLELVAPDGSDWLLRLDPDAPLWTVLSSGPAGSATAGTVQIEAIATDPAQFTVIKAVP